MPRLSSHVLRWSLLAAALWGPLAAIQAGVAAEPSRPFLEGLRRRGLDDVALDYLERMRNSPAAAAEFRETIDYQKALILQSQPGTAAEHEQRLAEAQACLIAFLQGHPKHPLAATAQAQLGKLLIDRGRARAQPAGVAHNAQGETPAGLRQGRLLFQQAEQALAEADRRFDEIQQRLSHPRERPRPEDAVSRDAARRQLLEIRLARAALDCEMAQTYPAGSRERRESLAAAAAKYHEMYQRHPQLLAGLYARLGEARCYQELGDTARAVAAAEDLLAEPDNPPAFGLLRSQALDLLIQTAEHLAASQGAVADDRQHGQSAQRDRLGQAAAIYRRILDRAGQDPGFAPSAEALTAVRLRFARTLRRLGEYPAAIQQLTEILGTDETRVDAQVEAAYTYQAWGATVPDHYLTAIHGSGGPAGGKRSPAGPFWGWAGIAKMAAGRAADGPLFHEARYNLAWCRCQYALGRPASERGALLDQAENDIAAARQSCPAMAGPEWSARYDELRKQIQQHRGPTPGR
jgi:tetratricopeptide (TPR) repeat protein